MSEITGLEPREQAELDGYTAFLQRIHSEEEANNEVRKILRYIGWRDKGDSWRLVKEKVYDSKALLLQKLAAAEARLAEIQTKQK